MAANAGTMLDVMKYFGITSAAKFKPLWSALSEQDKTHLKSGIALGTLTY